MSQLEAIDAATDVVEGARIALEDARQVETRLNGYFADLEPARHQWQSLVEDLREANANLRRAAILAQTRFNDYSEDREPSTYGVVTLSPMTKVERHSAPPGVVDGTVTVELARDEYESAQFTIWPFDRGLEDVTVQVSDLAHTEKKGVILAGDVDIRLVRFVECRPPEYQPDLVGFVPDPLFPYEPFDVPAGTHQPVWLTLHVSRALPAGTYEGSIEIRAPGETARTLPPVSYTHLRAHET